VIPVRILGTASVLPGEPVTTRSLLERVGLDPVVFEPRIGIRTRHFAPAGTPMAALGAEALRAALDAAGMPASDLRRVIFVSSSGGDLISPATANRVTAALGLAHTCDAIDVQNACLGFLSAFDLAARSIATGLGPVAVVVVELGSRYITEADHRPFLVFGDAAAAAVLGPGRPGEGIVASRFGNDGSLPEDVVVHHPSLTGKREYAEFKLKGLEMTRLALELFDRAARAALDGAGVALADVEWILPHQPNGPLFSMVVDLLGLDRARLVPVVEEVGSVGAAAIPLSLDRLLRTRPVRAGDRILMFGVGAGVGVGGVLYRVG
jgi:3-oxoacyl-(acyl-carrier-protein) synthase III